jgi:methyl-accepting chemotaxis protein
VKNLRLTVRLLIGLAALDLISTCVYLVLTAYLLGSANAQNTPILALLTLVRLVVIYRQVSSRLGPAEQLSDAVANSRGPTQSARLQDDLSTADVLLQTAPLRLAALVALLWTASTLALPVIACFNSDSAPLTAVLLTSILAALGLGLGIFAVALPGGDLLIIEVAGLHSILARKHQVLLRRPKRSIGHRIVGVALCLASASALVVASLAAAANLNESEQPMGILGPRTLVTLLLLNMAWAWACSVLLARSVLSPFGPLGLATRRIAEHGDLSQIECIPAPNQDEVGNIIASVNEQLETMAQLASAANSIGNGNLEVEIRGEGELPEAFRVMVGRLKRVVQETWTTSSELASAATEISAAAQELEVASSSQASGMVEIAQTMDSLSKSAAHVSEAVQGVAQNAERTLQNTQEMVSRIDSLSTHANRIGDILEVIREIANQSDLLALNGSLEATRVGEAGRGFALVAGEMRRLAERVTASVQDVKKLVADIRQSGASTVVATEESKKLAEGTAGAARSITLVTQQQLNSTEQVNQSVRALSEIVEQAALATTQTRTSAEGLKVYAERLAQVVMTFHIAK